MFDAQNKSKREAAKKPSSPAAQSAEPALTHTGERISFQLFTQPPAADAPSEREADAAAAAVVQDQSGGAGAADAGATPSSPGGGDGAPPSQPSGPTAPFGVIVEDDSPLSPGQMRRTQFMETMSAEIERAADEELAGTGRTARDCPYLNHWLRFYRDRPAAHVERAIERYARPERTDLISLREAVVARVRVAVQAWVRSDGREVQTPDGVAWLGQNDGLSQSSGTEAPIQRKAIDGAGAAPSAGDPASARAQLHNGHPLDSRVRARMEGGFGRSFSDVRLHTDDQAAQMASSFSARAFTVGSDIAFGAGQYRPGTIAGDSLIAHELAHTVQQRGATMTAPAAAAPNADLEQSANESAAGALLRPMSDLPFQPKLQTAGGLRLQRCGGGDLPEQTIDWQNVNREEYDAAVKKIRELHEQEKKLLVQPGWDDKRTDELAKIQDGIREQVQKLQDMGIRRDAPEILRLLLQDTPQDLRQVTGRIEGGSETIYWGEPRKLDLHLDYLPKNVDWWVQWSYEPNTADINPLAQPSMPRKDLSITLDAGFWASYDRFGGSPDPAVRRTQTPGFSIMAKLFLGSQQDPAATFPTQYMELKEDVPSALAIEAPGVLNLPAPGAAKTPGAPPPTTAYALKDAETEFRLSWSPRLVSTRKPKHLLLWWVMEPGASAPSERQDLQQWSVRLTLQKPGATTVGAKIFRWDQKPTDTPILSAEKTVQCVTHDELGKLALAQAEKDAPNADYPKYLADLDKQIAEIEETAKAGTVAPKILGARLEALREQRKKILGQVGGKTSVPFPATDAGFNENAVHVTNVSAVLSMPEYGGAFPLSVFVTVWKDGDWKARITDATTQDVISFDGSSSTPLEAVKKAINKWQGSNEYPQGGSLHYSLTACGWNLKDSFGTSTFKKEFWKWFDRILFISSAIVALILILTPEPTGATKVAGLALLGIGILRSAYNIYNNLSLGRPVLDQRNVIEAINIVASIIGIKGGMMMSGAGKGVALGEPLIGKALTTFKVGKGLVLMSAAADVGTFVYITGDAIAQLQAAANDPKLSEAQRERLFLETYLRLVTQGLLIIGTNAQLFRGATPRGTNLGMFLDKVAGANAEIKLDPAMRSRLQSEFRKINAEVDVNTMTDRQLVMELQFERVRSKMLNLRKRPEIDALLKKKPELQTGLEQNPKLIDLISNDGTVRNVLVKRPEVMESLLKHPDAIDIVERAVARAAGAKGRAAAPPAQNLTTPLSQAQLDISKRIGEATPKGKSYQPGFDPKKIGDAKYTEGYLDDLYKQAEVAQKELTAITDKVAAATKGEAGSRTDPKLRSRSMDKINSKYKGDASQLTDLAGSKIVYRTLDDLYHGLESVEKELGGKIVNFEDRFIKPMESGYRDIQLNVRLSNGHIAEFRLHLESIETAAVVEHAAFEVRRALVPVAKESGRGLNPAERALDQALITESQALYGEALAKGEKTP